MKQIFVFIAAALLLSSCTNYGEKIAFGKNEVFYKGDGVTEAQAKKLGKFLEEQDYFDDKKEKSVQLTKDEDDYIVHLVVDENKITDAAHLNWWKFQYDLSKGVFNNKPVRVALANTKLETIEVLNPVALYKIGKSTVYYDNSELKKSDAKKLGDFFTEIKLMNEDKEADAFYQKEEELPIVRLVVNPDKIDKEVLPAFSFWQEKMRENVFNGKKAKLILTSTSYEDLKPLPKLTAQQRQQFEAETNNTTTNTTQVNPDSLTMETVTSGVLRLPNN